MRRSAAFRALIASISTWGCASSTDIPTVDGPAVPVTPPSQFLTLAPVSLYESQTETLTVAGLSTWTATGRVALSAAGTRVNALISGEKVVLIPPTAWVGPDTLLFRIVPASTSDTIRFFRLPVEVRSGPFEVIRNPYEGVDWNWPRWKVQLHDHPGVNPDAYRAYDDAGYHAVVLMEYSGVPSLIYAWKARHWPAEQWLPASLLNSFQNIRTLIPAAEEVGGWHVTSPFLTNWIGKWEASLAPAPRAFEYTSTQGAIDKVREYGGFPILAHPWLEDKLAVVERVAGEEIYSAFASYRLEEGVDTFFTNTDRNETLLHVWDARLKKNSRVIGVAVNDHFGPGTTEPNVNPRTRDSGKSLILAPTLTLATMRNAMEKGALFAVRDRGVIKDHYPTIRSISVDLNGLHLMGEGNVRWVGDAGIIGTSHDLAFSKLPVGTTYVRAELADDDESIVFTQAFAIAKMSPARQREARSQAMILLTGATGFVGQEILRQAHVAGMPVRALVRAPIDLPNATESISVGDFASPLPASPFTGCSAVIHCAARAHIMHESAADPETSFLRANCEMAVAVAEAAASAGVPRFVFISSIKVLGESTSEGSSFRPADSPAPTDAYARSKAAAERELRAVATRTGMELVIVRPPLIHGAGAKGNLAALINVVRRSFPLPFGAIANRRSLIHIENLADFLLLAASHPAAAGQTLHVTDGDGLSTPDIIRRIAEGLRVAPHLWNVPAEWLRTLGKMVGKEGTVSRLVDSLEVESLSSARLLSWRPRISTHDGLRQMAEAARS